MRFSIITCTYNSEEYLQKNMDSIKNQTFKDFEHIFIDGFSTDKTMEIIEKYQKDFPEKVRVFQFPAKGIANAMNIGIEKSNGKYINHMHSDDSFYSNDILRKISDFIDENNHPDLIYGKAIFLNLETKTKRIIPHRIIYQKLRFWLLLLTNYIPHQATFIEKEVFEKFGKFNERYKNSMDYEMWLRLSKNKIKSKFLNEPLCNFSVRKDSQSGFSNNTLKENLLIVGSYTKNKFLAFLIKYIQKINSTRDLY
jgi:glycosyltransferase involved in cell wall biosynthesis